MSSSFTRDKDRIEELELRLEAAHRSLVMVRSSTLLVVLLVLTGCAVTRHETGGGAFTHRFTQPPEKAASCFARNAEEHSSALVAEVRRNAGERAQVVVRVRNGVPYATADFQPAGSGSVGTIQLMVVSSGGSAELVRSLVEGC